MDIEAIQTELSTKVLLTGSDGIPMTRLQVIARLLELIGGWEGLIGHLDREQVKKVVLEFYRAYIKPLDIPGIPFLFEPMVDEAIERLLEAVIDRVFDQVPA